MIDSIFQKRGPAFVALLVLGTLACVGGVSEGTATDDAASSAVAAQQAANVSCEMKFSLQGWSAIVSKSEGKGTVTCDNGQTADVVLQVTGGGLSSARPKSTRARANSPELPIFRRFSAPMPRQRPRPVPSSPPAPR